ncbi:MAG: AraC family transcriptional regulator ligand-binding domain-containing protein [Terracidiphilus sp.]|jgi:AraC-like DNA-binding protein
MSISTPSRFRIPRQFWPVLRKLLVEPASVLRRAGLPLTFIEDDKSRISDAHFFSIWDAIGELSNDPAIGLKMGCLFHAAALPPSMLAAYYARDYRDAITRHERFLQIRGASEMRINEHLGETSIEWNWKRGRLHEPPLLTDVTFAMLVEMGRRGTEQPFNPKRIELKRPLERTGVHRAFFQCPVKFRAARNVLIFDSSDFERPFVTYNAELLEMLQPQLDKNNLQAKAEATVAERVKWILKRMLAGGRPDASVVARELGLSVRTLQRRIVDEGTTFRELLSEIRKELAREYLSQPGMPLTEIAYLLGFEDTSSFYRAFRTWEDTTPERWRADSGAPGSR